MFDAQKVTCDKLFSCLKTIYNKTFYPSRERDIVVDFRF